MGCRSVGVLLVAVGLNLPSVGRAQSSDPWAQAQQAFSRFDYAASLRFSAETLARQPQNMDARRVAARSARELDRYVDCLRYVGDIPSAQLTSDDVGLIGECSARSSVNARIINTLQQQLSVADNREIAAFWLGRFAYLREDYRTAEKYLSSIQILPDRFEKERAKMMERMRDLQRAHSAVAAGGDKSRVMRGRSAEPESRSGGVGQFRGVALVEGHSFSPTEKVSLESFEQKGFEAKFTPDSVVKTKERENRLAASSLLDLFGGWRLRAAEGFQFGLGVRSVLAGSVGNTVGWIYQAPGMASYPSQRLGDRGRGVEVRLQPEVTLEWGRVVGLGLSGGVRANAPDKARLRFIPYFDVSGSLRFDKLLLSGSYAYERIYGNGGGVGLVMGSWLADARLERVGPLSVRAPEGYSLFRYARSVAVGSREFVRFLVEDGDYVELNFAPRLRVASTFEIGGWGRYLNGSSRQFWSGTDLAHFYKVHSVDEKTAVTTMYERTAMYKSTTTDVNGLVTWMPVSGLSFELGAGWRKQSAQATDFVAVDLDQRGQTQRALPEKFRDLLNKGGETGVRLFGSLSSSF